MNGYTSNDGPTFLGLWNLNYYMCAPSQLATIGQQQPTRSIGPWTECSGGVIDNGTYIDPFSTSNEAWVTNGVFFNGVVPWEISIIFFKVIHYISYFDKKRCHGL